MGALGVDMCTVTITKIQILARFKYMGPSTQVPQDLHVSGVKSTPPEVHGKLLPPARRGSLDWCTGC